MRVLIATGLYPPQIGGPATYAKLLHDDLPEYDVDVKIVNFGSVLYLPKGIRHLVYFVQVLFAARTTSLIYALDPVSVGLPCALVARVLRKRFVVRIAGDYAWEQGMQRFGVEDHLDTFTKDVPNYRYPVRILFSLQKWVAKEADRIVVPSKYLARHIHSWGIPQDRIEVIYSVFEGVAKEQNRDALRSLLSLEGNLIISAGRFVPWKGFETLIETMPELMKRVPHTKLIIAGDGGLRASLERQIQKLGLTSNVVLTGSLDQRVLHSYIRAADVFVLNTAYEGFSHLLLEAMALGTPIVTTRVGGNPELITHEVEGLLVGYDQKDALLGAIHRLLTDHSLRERVVRGAKARVAVFTKEKMLQQLSTLFRELVV